MLIKILWVLHFKTYVKTCNTDWMFVSGLTRIVNFACPDNVQYLLHRNYCYRSYGSMTHHYSLWDDFPAKPSCAGRWELLHLVDGSSESFERLGDSSQVTERAPLCGFFAHEHPFSNRFTFRTPKKDPTHATYRCRNEACGWRCSAYKNSDGLLLLRVKERTHTCTTTSAHGAASSKEWLDEVVSSHIQDRKSVV